MAPVILRPLTLPAHLLYYRLIPALTPVPEPGVRPDTTAMTFDQNIFAFRAGADAALVPGRDALREFLESPKAAGRMELHRDDLARYADLLKAVADFEEGRKRGGRNLDFHARLFYGALIDSCFFSEGLRTAVEQFKYYRDALARTDLKKPAAFIRSAEEEISRLRPGRRDDAARIDRLRGMIDERKKQLEAQKADWPALRAELLSISGYVRDNLKAVRTLCEAAVATLVGLQVGKKAEQQLIEGIKTHFKDEIRDHLQHGPVTKEYIESTKEAVARLSGQVAVQVQEDIYALSAVYEALHDHAGRFSDRLGPLISRAGARAQDLEQDKDLFRKIESELVSAVSDFQFELKPPREIPSAPEDRTVLQEKRRELVDRLFEMLRSSRRPRAV